MTNLELVEYYKNLIIIQYSAKQKAVAHIEALIDIIMFYELMREVENAYDIDTAEGVQLDILGKYLGIDRNVPTSPFVLTDTDFRFYLKLKIIQNSSNHSTESIVGLVFQIFGTSLLFYDRYNMTIAYIFPESEKALVDLAVELKLLPKPATVGLSVTYTTDISKMFGYRKYTGTPPPWTIGYRKYGGAKLGGWRKYG